MIRLIHKAGIAIILLIIGLSSCVNLKYINSYSSASLKSIQGFETINYSFKQCCLDNCQDKKINNLNLDAEDCDCTMDEKADSVTLILYNAVKGYFDGLNNLSGNELTDYKTDGLTKALNEGNFGSIKIDKQHVEAYSNISKILLRAFTDEYRKHQLKVYVREANDPLKVLIKFLDLNISGNLAGKLTLQKQRIKSYYFDLTKNLLLSPFEKRRAVQDYFQQLGEIEARQKELQTYSKALKIIAEGHQKLSDNIDHFSTAEIKGLLFQYACDIRDVKTEFDKIKK